MNHQRLSVNNKSFKKKNEKPCLATSPVSSWLSTPDPSTPGPTTTRSSSHPNRASAAAKTSVTRTSQSSSTTSKIRCSGSQARLTQPWRYERIALSDTQREQRLLVRVVIGKVTVAPEVVDAILQAVPVYQVSDERGRAPDGAAFSCLTWVRDALEELRGRAAVAGLLGFEVIQERVLGFVERKREEGWWDAGSKREVGVPVWDLLDGKEVVS